MAGKRVGISNETVRQAIKLADEAPDVFRAMKTGTVRTMAEAHKLQVLPADRRRQVLDKMAAEGVPLNKAEGIPAYWNRLDATFEWYSPPDLLESARRVFRANPRCVSGAGAFDLSGNVREWTADESRQLGAGFRVVRGGSFRSSVEALRCGYDDSAVNHQAADAAVVDDLGFRCCRPAGG